MHEQTSHFCKLMSLPILRSKHSNFVGVDVIAGSIPTLNCHHKGRDEESYGLKSKKQHTPFKKHKLLMKYLGEF